MKLEQHETRNLDDKKPGTLYVDNRGHEQSYIYFDKLKSMAQIDSELEPGHPEQETLHTVSYYLDTVLDEMYNQKEKIGDELLKKAEHMQATGNYGDVTTLGNARFTKQKHKQLKYIQ